MPRQAWLMDVLADEFRGVKGFRVDAYPGWETRGRELFNPNHVIDHHTGGGAYNNLLRYMAEGPVHPPLCNYATSRPQDGIVRITVVACGRANHAGRGIYVTIPLNQGNRYSFGAEHQNSGREHWPDQQIEAMRRCDRALLKKMGRNTNFMLDHKTYAPTRKTDRYGLSVMAEQAIVRLMLAGTSQYDQQEEEDIMKPHQETLLREVNAKLDRVLSGAIGGRSSIGNDLQRARFDNRAFAHKVNEIIDALDLDVEPLKVNPKDAEWGKDIIS
jgi:hypothetical protein